MCRYWAENDRGHLAAQDETVSGRHLWRKQWCHQPRVIRDSAVGVGTLVAIDQFASRRDANR